MRKLLSLFAIVACCFAQPSQAPAQGRVSDQDVADAWV